MPEFKVWAKAYVAKYSWGKVDSVDTVKDLWEIFAAEYGNDVRAFGSEEAIQMALTATTPGGLVQALNEQTLQMCQQKEQHRLTTLSSAKAAAPIREDDGSGSGATEEPTVRLQLQSNFKMKGGNDTFATEIVTEGTGVTVTRLDEAFERLVLDARMTSFPNSLIAIVREAYESHKEKWADYAEGKSYSVYFTKDGISRQSARDGYRLDVENIRTKTGIRNFI